MELGDRMKEIAREMRDLPEVKALERRTGKIYDPGKDQQNVILYRDILGCDQVRIVDEQTGATKMSTKEEVLRTIPPEVSKHPQLLIEFRSTRTIKSTFLDSLPRLLYPDGRLHPSVNDKFTATGRLSTEQPNEQNFPKHKLPHVRSVIVARPGCVLLSGDYGAIEYRVIGMASEDKRICDALSKGEDVHREWALYFLEEFGREITDGILMHYYALFRPDQITWEGDAYVKQLRQAVKNQWVFPRFFGSGDKACARYLGVPFEVAQDAGRAFWDEFNGVRKWQKKVVDRYERKGYVEMLSGRRRRAPMPPPEIINAIPQGGAAEIELDAMARLSEAGYQASINVHDDLVFEFPADRLEEEVPRIAEIMCCSPYEWTTAVPLIVEFSVGGTWYNMDDIGVYSSREFR